ncbi:hypothetical protein [Brevibacillus sp. 179-C9.3 HS]|uniref:hypothetical protein n=1 Tax=unclassified Brevibacillus TaxID=2684853 RepID=UPI0039A2C8E8
MSNHLFIFTLSGLGLVALIGILIWFLLAYPTLLLLFCLAIMIGLGVLGWKAIVWSAKNRN